MKTAMILAAGRGERLRPITDVVPKALCKVHGIPLIEYHVINLAKTGFNHIIINHAHLGGQIRQHLGNGNRWGVTIEYSPEPPGGLETGGGIVNALPLLGDQPFITVNADILIEFDFSKLRIPNDSSAHIILIPKPEYSPSGDFGMTTLGKLQNSGKEYTVAGVIGYRPEIFKDFKPGRFSVVPLLRSLTEQEQTSGELFLGKWLDIGTPERLMNAHKL